MVTSCLISSVQVWKKSRVTPALRASSFTAQRRASREMAVMRTRPTNRQATRERLCAPGLDSPRPASWGIVESEQLPFFAVPVVAGLDGGAAPSPHLLRLFRMGQQVLEGACNILTVEWIDQQSAAAALDDFAPQGKVRCDHGHARTHVLKQLDGKSIDEVWDWM